MPSVVCTPKRDLSHISSQQQTEILDLFDFLGKFMQMHFLRFAIDFSVNVTNFPANIELIFEPLKRDEKQHLREMQKALNIEHKKKWNNILGNSQLFLLSEQGGSAAQTDTINFFDQLLETRFEDYPTRESWIKNIKAIIARMFDKDAIKSWFFATRFSPYQYLLEQALYEYNNPQNREYYDYLNSILDELYTFSDHEVLSPLAGAAQPEASSPRLVAADTASPSVILSDRSPQQADSITDTNASTAGSGRTGSLDVSFPGSPVRVLESTTTADSFFTPLWHLMSGIRSALTPSARNSERLPEPLGQDNAVQITHTDTTVSTVRRDLSNTGSPTYSEATERVLSPGKPENSVKSSSRFLTVAKSALALGSVALGIGLLIRFIWKSKDGNLDFSSSLSACEGANLQSLIISATPPPHLTPSTIPTVAITHATNLVALPHTVSKVCRP